MIYLFSYIDDEIIGHCFYKNKKYYIVKTHTQLNLYGFYYLDENNKTIRCDRFVYEMPNHYELYHITHPERYMMCEKILWKMIDI